MILDYLRNHEHGLTSKEAEDFFGCMRLASRISDLKRDGWKIESKTIKVKTRSGFAHVSLYTLGEQDGRETNAYEEGNR